MKPPMTPKDAKKSPSSSVTIAGMIVWYLGRKRVRNSQLQRLLSRSFSARFG